MENLKKYQMLNNDVLYTINGGQKSSDLYKKINPKLNHCMAMVPECGYGWFWNH